MQHAERLRGIRQTYNFFLPKLWKAFHNLGRKNYLFAGNHEAAENIAMFYSFFRTCKRNKIDPQKWLTYAINNINDTKASQIKELLPQFIDKNLLT